MNQIQLSYIIRVINIHAAKAHPSRLADEAAGETFVVPKAEPMVQVMAIPETLPRRRGFLTGQIQVPDDFDRMGEAKIEQLFGSGS